MNVQDLIDKAGGVSKMAKLCKVSHSSVCDWKRSNTIPGNRLPRISTVLNIPAADLVPLINAPKCTCCEAA